MSTGVWIIEARCLDDGPDAAISLSRAVILDKETRLRVEQVLWGLDWLSQALIREQLPVAGFDLILKRPTRSSRPLLSARFPERRFSRATRFLESLVRVGWREVRMPPQTRFTAAKPILQNWRERLPNIEEVFGGRFTPTPTPLRRLGL